MNPIVILIIILVVLIILALLLGLKKEADDNLSLYLKESIECDSLKEELKTTKEELEAIKAIGRVIKIEKFYAQPKEISSKLTIQSEVIDDEKMFKDIIIHELSRSIAEEIALDPYFYKVFFSFNAFDNCETVEVRTRVLPYMEAAEWKDFKGGRVNEN